MPTGRHHTGPGSGGSRRDNGGGRSGRGRGSGKGFGEGPRGEPSGEFRKTWRDTLEGYGYIPREKLKLKKRILREEKRNPDAPFEYEHAFSEALGELVQKIIEREKLEADEAKASNLVIQFFEASRIYDNALVEFLLSVLENPKDHQKRYIIEKKLSEEIQSHCQKFLEKEIEEKEALVLAREFFADYKAFEQVIESILKEYDEAEGE